MKTPEEFLKAEQIEDCELQVGNVVLLSYPPQVPVKKLSQLLTDFASQSKPQLNIEKMVDGIVDSLGETSKGNDYQIHSIRGERWITHKEIGSGEPLKQWIESELKKIVKAVDPTFWRRLEMFVSNIQVNDMAGEEEKQYIIHVIESKKEKK